MQDGGSDGSKIFFTSIHALMQDGGTNVSSVQVQNTRCSKILQSTLLISVANDLRPFMVGRSHDCFTLLSVKDVKLL
jgi:hypothetical protein